MQQEQYGVAILLFLTLGVLVGAANVIVLLLHSRATNRMSARLSERLELIRLHTVTPSSAFISVDGWETIFRRAVRLQGDTFEQNAAARVVGSIQNHLNTAGIPHEVTQRFTDIDEDSQRGGSNLEAPSAREADKAFKRAVLKAPSRRPVPRERTLARMFVLFVVRVPPDNKVQGMDCVNAALRTSGLAWTSGTDAQTPQIAASAVRHPNVSQTPHQA